MSDERADKCCVTCGYFANSGGSILLYKFSGYCSAPIPDIVQISLSEDFPHLHRYIEIHDFIQGAERCGKDCPSWKPK